MAEHGAHLTSGGPRDTNRPSVFEVLAQESLTATVRPALRHAVRVFAEKYPDQLGRLMSHFDEIFLVFDTIVQSFYLKKYGGSFAENFYDLKRVPSDSPDQTLSPKLRLMSLMCLVLIPYIRQKLDSLFEELRYREGIGQNAAFPATSSNRKRQMIGLYLSLYPYFHSAWECLSLTYMLTYMLRRGRWHSPSLHLSGTELLRLGPDDALEKGGNLQASTWSDLSSIRAKLHYLAKLSLNTTAACLSTSLSAGVFFLQFLDWWYASDSSAPSLTALPVPRPPQQERLNEVSHTSCPLCLRYRTNSTALAVSGYVFCYPCIVEHLRKEKCCPVTGYPATSEHLVKIYDQDL